MKRYAFILLFFLLSGLFLNAQDFYFVQITDTHLRYRNHTEVTNKIVESINNLPFDIGFVVHTGDIFQNNLHDQAAVNEFYTMKENLNLPLYVVPGNHDLLPQNYDTLVSRYQEKIGPLNQIKYYDSVSLILFYSIPFADTLLPDVETQKQWIEHSLSRLKDEQVLLFHHQPSVPDFYLNKLHESWPEAMYKYWVDLLNKYQVDAVITGHFHRDEHHYLGEVPLYVSSSIAGFWGRQASFRVYHYQQGKLSYQTVYYNE
ncbi:MAG: metallophosphoesterase [Bacteroidota bacterium]|nr:metallophosphoesterase [Bacteroidota bacterium]